MYIFIKCKNNKKLMIPILSKDPKKRKPTEIKFLIEQTWDIKFFKDLILGKRNREEGENIHAECCKNMTY